MTNTFEEKGLLTVELDEEKFLAMSDKPVFSRVLWIEGAHTGKVKVTFQV